MSFKVVVFFKLRASYVYSIMLIIVICYVIVMKLYVEYDANLMIWLLNEISTIHFIYWWLAKWYTVCYMYKVSL